MRPEALSAPIVADRAHVARSMVAATGLLLPKLTLGGAAIYAGFTVLYTAQGQGTAIVTAVSAVLFAVLSRLTKACSLRHVHMAIAAIVAIVVANVSTEYAVTQTYLHGLGFVFTVMAAGILMPTLMWWLAFAVASVVAWAAITLALQIEIVLFEATLALFMATVLGGLLLFVRLRMAALAESLRLSLEATRDRELREILDTSAEAILLHRTGTIAYANPALATMLATHANLLVGRRITELTSQASLDRLAELLDQRELSSVRSDGPLKVGAHPITLTRSDGTGVTFELAEPRTIWFEGGAAVMWSGRDLSAEQQAMHARLLAADRMAVAGSLASGLAHEINNPLTVVRLNLPMLADLDPSELPELVEEMSASVARIEAIVGDLAALSPARADAIEDVAVDRALQHAVTLAFNEIRHRAEVSIEALETPPIKIARSKLTQAMVNLLIHLARQHETTPGQRMIARTKTAPDGRALVELVATSVVLSDEAKRRMFEPFFTTSIDGFGGGLGLYYCHSVVTGAGGTIEISSDQQGTTIRIAFPPAQPVVATAAHAPPDGQRVRVLVIDDEAAVGRAIKRVLANCEVEVSTSGAEGIARYEDLKPDLVLCDLMMPELSGPVVYETLRARFPEIDQRIVFMTGGVFTTKTQTFVDTTALPVLKKPVAITQLRDLVARYARA